MRHSDDDYRRALAETTEYVGGPRDGEVEISHPAQNSYQPHPGGHYLYVAAERRWYWFPEDVTP